MPTIREIAIMDDDVREMLAASEGEVTPEIEAVMESLGLTLRDKVDGYVHVIEREEAMQAAQQAEAAYHTDRAKYHSGKAQATANRIGRLKYLLEWFMRHTGRLVLEGEAHTIKFEGVGGQRPLVKKIEDAAQVPDRFAKVERTIDWKAVRAGIDAGDPEALAIAVLAPKGERLAIR